MHYYRGIFLALQFFTFQLITLTGEDDFREVFRCTVHLKTCYYELGRELGLPPQELQDKPVGDPLTGVLLAWLSQRYDTERYGVPTWRRLVEAVDNPAGGNNHELAKTIASKHPTGIYIILYQLYFVTVFCVISSSSIKRI